VREDINLLWIVVLKVALYLYNSNKITFTVKFETDRSNFPQVRGPAVDLTVIEEKKLTVV